VEELDTPVRGRSCWICVTPAIALDGSALEPIELDAALDAVAHLRCLPLADLARRSVYRADGEKLGARCIPKLHIRSGGAGGSSGRSLLCKNSAVPKRRVGVVRDFSGVHGFSTRDDACAVCARELAAQSAHLLAREERQRSRARVVTSSQS
jgi:hypothetical protein